MQEIIKKVEKAQLQTKHPDFSPGDTVAVSMIIREAGKERVQSFQGVVVQKRGVGMGKTLTVRKSSAGVYVEKVFPLHSPLVSEIKVVRKGSVRRARLFYLRKLSGKATRIQEKQ